MAIAAIANSVSLRQSVLGDGIMSGVFGVALIVGAAPLSPLLGIPAAFLFWLGVALLPWMASLIVIGRQERPKSGAVETVVAVNALWVLGSIAVAIWNPFGMTAFGFAFVAAQGIAVALIAELQFSALRREA
jgi:hypothetical protein